MVKKILGLIACFISIHLSSQTLYWVGGSGYWNDANHWSTVSGGNPSHQIPNATTNVVFDDYSATGASTVHVTQSINIKTIASEIKNFNFTVISSPSVDFTVFGDIKLNEHFFIKTNGDIYLKPTTDVLYQFSHNKLNNNVYIVSSKNVELGTVSILKTLNIKGNFHLKNSTIVTENITIQDANVDLNNNIIQVNDKVEIINSNLVNTTSSKINFICTKDNLSTLELNELNAVSNLKLSKLAPAACVVTLTSFTNPTCAGLCNGTAVFDLSACTNPPFSIQWLSVPCSSVLPPAQGAYTGSTYSVNTLCGCVAAYSVLFENNLSEQFVFPFVPIVDPPATILSFSQTQPTCFGLCNGQIRLNVLLGLTPLTINWNPPNVTRLNVFTRDTLKNACAGIYTITATNSNTCINTFTTILVQPPQLLTNGATTSVTCGGVCNASGTVSPTGGTGPYTYSWSAGVPTNTNITTGLCPGVVTATVVDSKTCTATFTSNITQPPATTVSVLSNSINCNGFCTGSATVSATGGVPPFTYSILPAGVPTGSVVSGLCAGSYSIIASDAQACAKTVTFTIAEPPTFTATPTQTNITCNGLCNGSINLNPTGGTPAYSYVWSPSGPNSPTRTNLCFGVYTYTITDALLCKRTGTVTLTQPPATTLTITKSNVNCFGLCNGSATLAVAGGTPTHSVTWTPTPPLGQNTFTISSLCVGSYTASITDGNGCPSFTVVTITQPSSVTPNIGTVQPTCNGFCNGSITSTPTGGVGAFTFTLQSATSTITTNPPYNGLCAGTYTLLISNNGCVIPYNVIINQPNSLTLSLNATPINCFGQCNSSVSSVVNGGTPVYTFTWSNGSNAALINGQCIGIKTATVTDSEGCIASASITVTSPASITVNVNVTSPSCFGSCNAIATASVGGGTPNYTYQWQPSGGTNNIESGLCAGIQTLTVTDNLLCTRVQTVNIIAPTAMTLTPSNGTVSCSSVCDGTVGVVAIGGTPGYSFNWTSIPSQTTAIASNLCGGNYFVTVTDLNGCIANSNATVIQPPPLTAVISGVASSCNVCTGASTVTASGGTLPYSYSWTDATNTQVSNGQIATSLCVGFYTITVTDFKGCVTTQTVEIIQTVTVFVTTNGNVLQCNNACTGIATANPSGGVGAYSYTWTPTLQSTQTATALCAGVYTVEVADELGCSNTGTVSFVNPPAATVTVTKTDETCFGQCNGAVSVTAIGGTGAFTFQWLPGGQTTTSISGLCGGIYTVNVLDGNSCLETRTIQIVPATSITATFVKTDPTTCVSNDGSITASISGGLPPYTFTWSPGGSVNPLINVPAGIYNLFITDAAGCTQTLVATLSNPSGPTVTATSSSVTCFGLCNGSATATAVGVAPLSYSWNAGATPTNSITTGLCAGTSVITVTDGNSCAVNTTVNIAQPTQLTTVGIASNIKCNSVCTGSINLTPTGGTAPYTYTWSPAGGSVQDPTGLCAGNYTVITIDNNSCFTTNTFVITEPIALSVSFTKKDVLCNGVCTGGAKVITLGGTTPYTYAWSPSLPFVGSTVDTAANLCAGIYTVLVTDANGCTITGTVQIGEPTLLTSSMATTSVSCNALCDGSATLTPNGGTVPYSFTWNNLPPASTSTVGGLCAGNYQGIVTDNNGCVSSQTIIITQPTAINTTITPVNPKCANVCNGSFSTTVNGGSPGYTFQWIPLALPTGTLQNPTGLCAGNYTLLVTDSKGCIKQTLSSLTDPQPLFANATFTSPTCNGVCNGIATANAIGGTLPYTYTWDSPTVSAQTISNLCPNDYTVTVVDGNLCVATQTITLIQPIAISVNPAVTPAACGLSNGSIDASAVTGLGPFTYNWLPPISSTNTVVTNVAAGVYTLIVTNVSSCSATVTIPVSNSNGPTGATITTTNVACENQCNGIANVSNVVGGTPSYTLSWVNPLNASPTVTGLCAGTYTAQIRDANNCLFFQSTTITEPQAIDDNEVLTSAACFGNCNGSIALNPSGGNGGYTYSWNPSSASTGTVTNLCPGPITATITDSKGCTFTANYNLPSLVAITSSMFATNNICFGDCNGSLLVNNIAGGLPPYNVLWSDPLGQTTSPAIGLCNGNYTATITDANGCVGVNSSSIISNSQVVVNTFVTQPSCDLCNGTASLTPSGGAIGPYTFVWSNTQIINPATNLCAGVYGVQITDNQGCKTNTSVVVNSSSGITSQTITKQDETCFAACNGTVNVTAIGGVLPITYNWIHNNSSSQSQTGLCAGIYYCNMVDANGCSRTASVVIGSVASLSITGQVNQSACSGNTGSITVNVSGGAGGYVYVWTPASLGTTSVVTGLTAGIYTLTVTDANLCSKTQVFTVNSINGPVLTSTVVNTNCSSASCTGSIVIAISGGIPSYTTTWSTGGSGSSITGLCSGNYSVMVTDNVGCVAVKNFSISGSNSILFSAPDLDNPKCFNDCNGSLTAIPSGGSLPFTYAWAPSTSSVATTNSLCAGPQTITITDSKGCVASQVYTIVNPAVLTLTASVLNPTCSAVSNGSIGITAIGGTPTYSYSWSGTITSTLQSITNLSIGNYSLSITDANGCKKDTAIVLTSTLVVDAIAGRDTSFCQNGSLTLNGSSSIGGTTYNWILLPSTASISNTTIAVVNPPVGTSTYVLIVSNGGCIDRDSIKVTSNSLPVVDAGPFANIPINTSTVIGGSPTSSNGGTYTWAPNSGTLDNPFGSNPTASNTITTQYTVTVIDVNGCTNSDTVTVLVYPDIKIPNGFSPNSDGKNDVWQIDNIQQFPDNVVEVYNRWGELLFLSKGYDVPFDGRYKGKNLPVGTYYYVINLNNPAFPNAYTGPLTIFR